MATIYNISLQIGNIEDKLISFEKGEEISNMFVHEGLTGEKHVDEFGKLYNNFDSNCKVYKIGLYKIVIGNKKDVEKKSIKKLTDYRESSIDKSESKSKYLSGSKKEKDDAIEDGVYLAHNLHEETYSQMENIRSMSINTSIGIQSASVFDQEGQRIQLWKPKNSGNWYDYDILMHHLFDLHFDFKKYNKFEHWKRQKAYDLYLKLNSNPDDVQESSFKFLRL